MFKKILVPLDGSKLAECVLPHLSALATSYASQVCLLRVLEPLTSSTRPSLIDPVEWQIRKAEAETYLSTVAANLRAAGVQAEHEVIEGRAADNILENAGSFQADLIIMSSHGQSGLSPWNVSSVVQQVILRAHRSVMIVPAYLPVDPDIATRQYKKIFVPLDGSARAEMTLPLAESLARQHQAELLVAHVVRLPELPRRTPPTQEDLQLAEQLTERNRAEAERYLEELKNRASCDLTVLLEVNERVTRTLHRMAEEHQADLVLLGAHGYSGDTRWPYGSVVVSFITYGAAPMLILQDLPSDRIEPTPAELASRHVGGR